MRKVESMLNTKKIIGFYTFMCLCVGVFLIPMTLTYYIFFSMFGKFGAFVGLPIGAFSLYLMRDKKEKNE
jgi:hypothetical protein